MRPDGSVLGAAILAATGVIAAIAGSVVGAVVFFAAAAVWVFAAHQIRRRTRGSGSPRQ